MKILFYNWSDLNGKNVGGGVGVYQKNIIDAFSKYYDNKLYFLFSGEVYSPVSRKPYIKKTRKQYPNCETYALINSTVIAPAWTNYYNIESYLDDTDETILNLVADFIRSKGGFDVIHFNNIEGLPLNILKLKESFPDTKIIFSIHNYFPFCPSVNLYDFSKHKICENFNNGNGCMHCHEINIRQTEFKAKIRNFSKKISPIIGLLRLFHKKDIKRRAENFTKRKNSFNSNLFKEYRKKNIEYLNKYADVILSVSKRVKELATIYGINPDKNFVSYIGTKVADTQAHAQAYPYQKGNIMNIAYLGYLREDKGFFFLMDALKSLPLDKSERISIKLIAKGINEPFIQPEINKLREKYASVITIDGYTHENFKELLTGVNLGIVPVVWEDNLPQVAIELVSVGIPILASSSGGPSELSSSKYFKFEVADVKDFNNKLIYLLDHPEIFGDFWKHKMKLVTLEEHVEELLNFYTDNQSKKEGR